jgi:translation initiation factor 2B subunit (eIF-2B alpha/beta/delta family)
MEILADGFNNASDYLKDAGRAEVAALIVAGGWLEGLYLATSLASSSSNNARIIDIVIDQRLSLTILIKLLDNYKNLPNVSTVYGWLNELQDTYDKVRAEISETKVETTADGKTVLTSNNSVVVNDMIFKAICQKTDSIRNIIVK